MASRYGPNETVGEFLRRNPRKVERCEKPRDPWFDWVCEQARAGVTFNNEAEARAAYAELAA